MTFPLLVESLLRSCVLRKDLAAAAAERQNRGGAAFVQKNETKILFTSQDRMCILFLMQASAVSTGGNDEVRDYRRGADWQNPCFECRSAQGLRGPACRRRRRRGGGIAGQSDRRAGRWDRRHPRLK